MSVIFNYGMPGLIALLPSALRTRLVALAVPLRYRDKQHIQSRGDRTQGLSIIQSGAVCFGKVDSEGRFMTAAVFEAGQCYGEFTLFAGLPRTHDGYAEGDTVISYVSKARFDQLLDEEPSLGRIYNSLLTIRMHYLLEWLDDLRRYPLKYRLGKTLLMMQAEAGTGRIDITQGALGEIMGVSRVAVAKVLADYRRRGFVRVVYGGLEIADEAALRDWLGTFAAVESIAPLVPLFPALGQG
ncbi:MAG: Crp/Fnr family transcriptional regulator [Alphaproteobacteria bacterium]|nr:MAG: Crp/Fnr family transcriptional regulator [Alphaproteobacteria bacterium]